MQCKDVMLQSQLNTKNMQSSAKFILLARPRQIHPLARPRPRGRQV